MYSMADNLIHQIIVVCVVLSEIYLLHTIVEQLKRPESDKTLVAFTVFASFCILGIGAMLFTQVGETYECLFRAGTSLFCLCNMFVLVRVMKDIKIVFSD